MYVYIYIYIYIYVCNGFTSEVYKFAYPAAMNALHGKEEDNGLKRLTVENYGRRQKTHGLVAE